ncbi:putative polyketide synthase [Lentithecium fluviatile CBS 122367]|uniref:Putative polyketide synthase n=1 Tax=Lentithecium fluviatile CBS 122367 TaxID=1168545 RepID=A0A6G1J9M2_9PLEO|nr:putative polyketide synthase [Lentithecium fluviatile CBS 122367]
MDPQQRLLLECTYHALENAGLPLETVSGSKTSVYAGSFSTDWQHLAYKDGEQCGTTTALGVQSSFNANRISWFFNFTGNSANIDTACSSSLVCLDLGCKGLRSGDSDMSIVAGSNIMLSPDNMHSLTNLNMLSPDGQCYSFDHRGNGYSRGEGFGILVLKRVSDAIRDGNTIRGIIRNTGCNQDGNTPSITLPSAIQQLALIREVYDRAGLSLEPTRFFEAHGTGTSVGDPTEATALGSAFRHVRTEEDPLWIGAVKSNIGHLEGASGIAGVIKTMLVLEKGIIPPNTNFERINPKIDAEFLKIKFPEQAIPWPRQGLRRASVNSFGNAGTNAHVVLDDVFHFLNERGLSAHHCTVQTPPEPNLTEDTSVVHAETCVEIPRVIVLSAHDEAGVQRQAKEYTKHFANVTTFQSTDYLDNLAWTLCLRRSSLPWKSFALVASAEELRKLDSIVSPAKKSITGPGLAFVFTGQGAQWGGMGKELAILPAFQSSLKRSEEALLAMGCSWNIREELVKASSAELRSPKMSQPLCTALQIGLVDLLSHFNIHPTAVIGHSSGEIAAAYSAGAISAESAMKIAYFRGTLSERLGKCPNKEGSMISVGLSKDEVLPYIEQVSAFFLSCNLTVSCVNSPQNVTVSGDTLQVDALESRLKDEKIFARKLEVEVAYHSPQMSAIAEDYRIAIQGIQDNTLPRKNVNMFSTVTGKRVTRDDLSSPDYWVSNMVLPVNFVGAMNSLLSSSTQQAVKKLDLSHRNLFRADMLVEIGPHSTLQGPINDILLSSGKRALPGYAAVLKRKLSALRSLLSTVGHIQCIGYPVDMTHVNGLRKDFHYTTLADLPEYVFNHSLKYWDEPRMSANYRTGNLGKLDLLGKPVMDWNDLEPCWRNHLRLSEMPWIEDHVVNGSLVYPGAGMLVMVIEAANQLCHTSPSLIGFEIKDVSFLKWLNVSRDSTGTETRLSMRIHSTSSKPLMSWSEFRLSAYENNTWTECCRGFVRATYKRSDNAFDCNREDAEELREAQAKFASITASCHTPLDSATFYSALADSGLGLGPAFHHVVHGTFDDKWVTGSIKLYEWPENEYPQPHVIHPTTLDSIFHIAMAVNNKGGKARISTMVPTFLRSLVLRKSGLSFPRSSLIQDCAWTKVADARSADFGGFAMSSSKDAVLLQFDDLRMTKVADYKNDSGYYDDQVSQPAYHMEFRPLNSWLLLEDAQQIVSNGISTTNGSCKTKKRVVVVRDQTSEVQNTIAGMLETCLQYSNITPAETVSLGDAALVEKLDDAIFVVLLEIDQLFLYKLTREAFDSLHRFFLAAKDVLWLNFAGGTLAGKPEFAIINGLCRSLCNERSDLTMTTVAFQAEKELSQWQLDSLAQVILGRHVERNPAMIDAEYLEVEGTWHVPRLAPIPYSSEQIRLRSSKENERVTRIKDAPSLALTVGRVGLLDTLHFVEDNSTTLPIGTDEVEVETRAIGMNFKDCLVALGQLPYANMGQECSGVVTRAGAKTGFKPGDRIVMITKEAFKTFSKGTCFGAFKIPDTLSFTTAVTIPTQFGTAGQVIYRLARLQPGETILVHSAAGGTGQALLQLSKAIGAGAIFATVSSREKMRLLTETYGIPEDHIFYSRDCAFSKGILRVTKGRGVDVVVNSLVGDALIASWECIAPNGRFIEIGRKDILSNNNLPMFPFRNNASFHAFDGSLWLHDWPEYARRDLEGLVAKFADHGLHPPQPLRTYDVSEVEQAFRVLQEGTTAGKTVLEVNPESQILATIKTQPSFQFSAQATYVIAGGLGGIGRATARWMAARGAKNLILLSRRGPHGDASRTLLEQLLHQGVRVETPACDITQLPAMQILFQKLSTEMPPIRGVFQMSIVAKDCLFKDLNYDSWKPAVECKTVGSWNLHQVLPRGMDFFIILASASGLAGVRGQTNYNAGNVYEDAFARHRVSHGEKTVALDLGAMLEDGILAENPRLLKRVLAYGVLAPITRQNFFGILDFYCNPAMPLLSPSECQVAIGVRVAGDDSLEGANIGRQPMFHTLSLENNRQAATGSAEKKYSPSSRDKFAGSESFDQATEIVVEAIVQKLGRSLASMQDVASIDRNIQLQMYGVDSLLAVELRNWIVKEFKAEVAVFETQGASTLGTLSMLVARRSEIKHDGWRSSAAESD